jgi:DNA-binding SARP family transcriptional activator/tetratricopeptide (TPR) repeat protein
MEFRVLGPLQVIGKDNSLIDVPSAAQRRLVCLLLARAGSVVSADSLSDYLGLSSGALRTAISRLRRVLGSEFVVSTPPGYELRADTIDVQDFQRLLALAATGDPVVARRSLEEAIGLWRGEAFAEFAHEEWALPESRRLDELRTGAVEDLVGILLDSGEWSTAIAELEPLIAAHPFRDRPRGLLMRALAGSGRRTDALRAFQAYRTFLVEEIGTGPSAELVALDRAIASESAPVVGPGSEAMVPDSTHNMAVLVTDMAGPMAPMSGLSREAGEEVRRSHLSILRQGVAEAGGTEVTHGGDGLMVLFATASAAMSCAVTMQQGIERDNRAHEHSVGLRVGVSAGEVTKDGELYSGEPLVEAAGLCASAVGGQILAADVVRATAGRRSPHQWRSLGPAALKGLRDPVQTVEVIWRPAAGPDTAVAPLPARLARRPTVRVVGRDVELETIATAAKRVAEGEGREVLLVSGEAGQGKTTLLSEAARTAFDDGACVLLGHCEEDLAVPYQLFAEAVGHYVTHAPEDRLLAHVEAYGSELSRLVPALATRVRDLPASNSTNSDTDRYLLFAAAVGLLASASQYQPVVLVFEDLQWADAGSLEMLRHLVAVEQPSRILVLASFRDTELSRTHPLLETLAVLRRQSGISRIELTGFDDDDVALFMEAAAGHSLDAGARDLARALQRETDGNPFFVGEVLRHLTETGAIYPDATGRWVGVDSLEDTGLPDSVREVIGARVGRLSASAGRVLSLAAVIGRDFDFDVLARTTAMSEEELLDVLDTAAGVALVRELPATPGRYNFAHALIQHTIYANLGPTRRARVHRQVAEALEDLYGDRPGPRIGELARHWFNADDPKDLGKALDYSRRAAAAAFEALAPSEALRYLTQALDLYARVDDPDPVLGLDLGIGLGTAQRQTGNPVFRDTLLDISHRAAALGDTEHLVAAALANDRGWYTSAGTQDTEKVEVLEMALDLLPADDPDRALVTATLCSELSIATPLERRLALAEEALSLAESVGDDSITIRVLNSVQFALHVPPLLEQSLARTADAVDLADSIGDAMLRFLAYHNRHLVAFVAGDFEEMDRCIEVMGSLTEQLGQPMLRWTHTYARATQDVIAGNTDRAEELVMEALQLGNDSGQPDTMQTFALQLMATRLQKGTLSELAPLIEQMGAMTPDVPDAVKSGLLLAHADGDRIDEARDLLEEFATRTGFDLILDASWNIMMCACAEAAIVVGDPKYAAPLFDYLAPWAAQWCTTGVTGQGPVSHFVGGLATVLGRFDEADAYFAQSTAMCDSARARFFAARTHLLWGQMLAQRAAPGDVVKARDLLTGAHTVAVEHGYATVARRAAAALQSLET